MKLSSYKYIYLVGIGGIGMSALARYFNKTGKIIYGYDMKKSDLCIQLQNEGVCICYQDNLSLIPDEIRESKKNETLVIYTPAISYDNKILTYFKNEGFTFLKRAEVLGYISQESFTIAISGTHGKTTTSTILSHILKQSGKDITAFLGGISLNYNTNILIGNEKSILIVEADEFDRSFLHLHPDIAIITSVDSDHLDTYKDKNDLYLAFQKFASQVKEKGFLLIENSINIDFKTPYLGHKYRYSAKHDTDYFAKNINIKNGKTFFDFVVFNEIKEAIELSMPGIHNLSNAIAASAISCNLGLSFNNIAEGLKTFKGIKRRYEKHINTEKLVYIDDYAHHPEEVSTTIDTTKELYPLRKLIVVFQPHLYSRTKDLANEFADSLQRADDLVLLDIYPAREKPIIGIDSYMLLDLCDNPKKEVCSKDKLLSILDNKDIDVLLTLGAGDIGTLVEPIKHMLN